MVARARVDIYGGRDPKELPAYFVSEAAHYLQLPPATVWSWALGGTPYQTQSGARTFQPVIDIADPANRMLSFQNLVELHVLSSIRRVHRVQLHAVRRAVKYLGEKFKTAHPLLEKEMLTDGKDLFIEHYGNVVNVSDFGQMEMQRVLEIYLKRIRRDKHGIPIRLFPFTRPREQHADAPQLVAIDPKIQFGKPCIAGTGIPTAIIAERHKAGDPVPLLAEDYGQSPETIAEALRYESRVAS